MPYKSGPVLHWMIPLILLLPLACERATDLRVEGNGFVVVECVLTQEERQTMRLTLTEQGTAGGYERLQKARICVYDETAGSIAGSFSYVGEDKWESDFSGQPEHTYRLEIEAEGVGLVSARTTMPATLCLKSLNPSPYTSDQEGIYEMGTRFLTGSLPDGPVWITQIGTDLHSYTNGMATSLLTVDTFNQTGKTYYLVQSEAIFKGMFGALQLEPGVFSLYHYVMGQPVHESFIRIPSLKEGGPRKSKEGDGFFTVARRYPKDSYDFTPSLLYFISPSEDYDRYLKELLIEEANIDRAEERFADLFQHKNLFSNIDYGIGIFGSYTQVEAQLSFPFVRYYSHMP